MRARHRIPSIFTLSMVDVLCCALGCVILLWLLNLRQAKEHEDTAAEAARRSAALLANAETDRNSAYTQLSERDAHLAELEQERARIRDQLAVQLTASHDLEDRLKSDARRLSALKKDVNAANARAKELQAIADTVPAIQAELKETQDKYAEKQASIRTLEKEIARQTQELTDAKKTLQVMQASRQALERELTAKDKELTAARDYKEKWTTSEGRVAELEKLLNERDRSATAVRQSVETLEEEKKVLRAEAARYRQSADNRFAGIELTGRRVIFLVDMSGSMELVDENTASPLKWQEVRHTLVKVMKSLPNLEKFQVIVFSERATFLLGSDDRWLDYDSKTSPEQVLAALTSTKPKGGTNMYTAFDAAFRYRARDLDTIYLFSDGLPNIGEGLNSEEARNLKEVERSDTLAKYIRKKLKTDWNFPQPNSKRVRINAVGFFYESPDVGAFLWALARENDGSFVGMSKP